MADVLILVSVLLLAAVTLPEPPELPSTPPESSSSTIGCEDELVAFSPCLPYISDPPNNISDSPPFQCCDNFAAAFIDNTAICLCYLVRNPQILGFPISSMKLLSLTSICPEEEKEGEENLSLESLCSGSTMLPPFRSITDHRGSSPRPRRPTPPSSSPRPAHTPHPGDHDNPSPRDPPGSGSTSPPFSNVDDNPTLDAQATTKRSSAIQIMCNYRLWVVSAMSIFLYISCKHQLR
ncbi:non-specific lipid transfer protein GPI-anchored 25 isoform X2 [Solanum dulcamara]|uniref:non-specific lipid transfer protein GPI-anchored 25 isoform X2 n=1 Tax=Solanum dulcamara TaxID=45834 RepID=UPI002486A0B5|nr:non-specific lipid transfer protein GPI-anchored 25 isoform X2 [Solanum dulcamara]